MAIICFTTGSAVSKDTGWAEGAYCPLNEMQMVKWEEYKGKCISEREANGYNDSDFFMTVWDDEQNRPLEIKFATTRFWSYPAFASSVDATEEVIEKYNQFKRDVAEYKRKKEREERAKELLEMKRAVSDIAVEFSLPYAKLLKVSRIAKRKNINILGLFGPKIRSKFKLSIREQIIEWAKDPSPKYNFPLSPRQSMYL